jgi:hypothetical protein
MSGVTFGRILPKKVSKVSDGSLIGVPPPIMPCGTRTIEFLHLLNGST